ncbi:hypothetical protein F5X68DRAFT_62965 [Plectosphaerella plurivora]|uniref:Zn(2)-C6 fungal-type domain-containing protein n=1 Tax=Plectosphaerella plurivora TaxID=936078 RepID=A0A9P8V0I0_9PEZI|nr:hypothetical protein F5X68DRAFT_62965 [Plectosphaerella plurivora]
MTQPTRTGSPFTSSPEGSRVDTARSAADSYSPRSRKYSTKLACKFCRKKRTKCDGTVPCGHCRTHQKDCVYEKSDQRTKSSLRSELDSLRRSLHASEAIIDALRHTRYRDRIVEQLQGGATNDQIAEMLKVLAAEDAAAPEQRQIVEGHHQWTMDGMLDSGRGATTMVIDPWNDTREGGLAPVYDDATPPAVFWNPLFSWPSDNGVLPPFDPDAGSLSGRGTGPVGSSFPGLQSL